MDRDEIIRSVFLLDREQLVTLQQFLYQLTCREEKRTEQADPVPEETESNE